MPTKADLEEQLASAERKLTRARNKIDKMKAEAEEGSSDEFVDAVTELMDSLEAKGLIAQADSRTGCIQRIRDSL